MKSLFSVITLLLVVNFSSYSQEEINNYKYIIVDDKFDFLKYEDQYQINSLTLFLFNKYGYNAYMRGGELPADLQQNRCLALTADVEEVRGGFLKTKLQILLRDCNDKVIAESMIGETRIKEYAKAYNVAVRNAFKTFQFFDYKYQPSDKTASAINSAKVNSVPADSNNSKTMTAEAIKKQNGIDELKGEVSDSSNEVVSEYYTGMTLYAQPMDNGFQVVDTEPKRVMFLLKTSFTDVYRVKDSNALVYKKDGKWYYESQNEDYWEREVINIKF